MNKPFELPGVEAEKAEPIRRYNNRKSFRNILRIFAVALLVYLWFPTAAIALQTIGDWIIRFGSAILTNRAVVFVLANLLVALILLISRDSDDEEDDSEYTSSYVGQFTSSDGGDSSKQIVMEEVEKVVVEANREEVKEVWRKKKEIIQPVGDYRRTESAKVVAIERLSSEEFRLKVESFIMEKKMTLIKENDVVKCLSHRLSLTTGTAFGYDSC